MSTTFLSAVTARAADCSTADCSTADCCTADCRINLTTLPHDLLVLVAERLPGTVALQLATCCSALKAAALSSRSWHERLHDMGFTEAGVARWLEGGRSLVEAYLYSTVKHEAVELSELRRSPVRAYGWRGACDMRLCIEFANRWPKPIWTFITPRAPDDVPAPWAEADQMACHPRGELFCSVFESHGRELQVLSLPRIEGEREFESLMAPVPLEQRLETGWLPLSWGGALNLAVPGACGTPVVTGVPLPVKRGLTVLSEVTIRLDAQTWAAAEASGELVLEVLQAIDVVCIGADDSAQASPTDEHPDTSDACEWEVPLDEAVATAWRQVGAANENYETDPFQPWFSPVPLVSASDAPPDAVFLRSRPHVAVNVSGWAFLKKHRKPPRRFTFTALRRTTAVLPL